VDCRSGTYLTSLRFLLNNRPKVWFNLLLSTVMNDVITSAILVNTALQGLVNFEIYPGINCVPMVATRAYSYTMHNRRRPSDLRQDRKVDARRRRPCLRRVCGGLRDPTIASHRKVAKQILCCGSVVIMFGTNAVQGLSLSFRAMKSDFT
jgi:hypothetical protein